MHPLSLVGLVLLSGIQSFPTGSPFCGMKLNALTIAHGDTSNGGLGLSVQQSHSGIGYEVTVTGSVKGLLLFAQDDDPKQHLGSFSDLPTGFKFNDEVCQKEGIISNNGTITHSRRALKTNATFFWTPDNYGSISNVTFQAIISGGKRPWQTACVRLDNSNCTVTPTIETNENQNQVYYIPPAGGSSNSSSQNNIKKSGATTSGHMISVFISAGAFATLF
jgi:hypothetical protein